MANNRVSGFSLLHEAAEWHALHNPSCVAVDDGKVEVTYDELKRRSDQIAWLLNSCGCGPNDRIGILIGNSSEATIAIVGALKSGCCYVPLNPEFPAQKLLSIAEVADFKVVISTSANLKYLKPILRGVLPELGAIVVIDGEPPIELATEFPFVGWLGSKHILNAVRAELSTQLDDDLAYIMFTSGTTGRPKGVMVSHRNAMNLVCWAVDFFKIRPGDRMSGHSALSFDLSVLDVFGPLVAGATCCPLTSLGERAMPARVVRSRKITIWFSVPSVITQLRKTRQLNPNAIGDTLRLSMFCGEALTVDAVKAWREALPNVPIYNLYGPTEAAIACSWYEVGNDDLLQHVPIGVACPNLELLVLKLDSDEIAGDREIGRLMISGAQLSPGYWRDVPQTSKVFRTHPLKSDIGVRIYETGDLAFKSGDGLFYCVGRNDSQIKYQGYRIELGEIESALLSHDAVLEVSASLLEGPEPMIVAAVAVNELSVDDVSLRAICQRMLPSYMIPARFLVLDELPKNANGKIDRKACARKFG